MATAATIQIVGANLAVAAVAVVASLPPGPDDREARVVRMPWQSAASIAHRIASAGGTIVASRGSATLTDAVFPSSAVLSALARDNPGLVLLATRSKLCVSPRKIAP